MTGYFLAIEGGGGAGKTSLAHWLHGLLETLGHDVVLTRQPGGTALGQRIRAMLLDPASQLDPKTEVLLYAADRAQHVAEVIRPALARGAVVVCDRYVDSSIAYQGAGRLMDRTRIAELSRFATDELVPDLTVVLDVDPKVGLARALRLGPLDRIESETLAFHHRVRVEFLRLAAAELGRYLVVDAGLAVEEIGDEVWRVVGARLPVKAGAR